MIRELTCVGTKNKCKHEDDYDEKYKDSFSDDNDDDVYLPLLVDLTEVAAAYPALDDDGIIKNRTYIALYNGSVFCINTAYKAIFDLIKTAKKEELE